MHLEQCIHLYDPKHHRAHAVLYVRDPSVSTVESWRRCKKDVVTVEHER